MSKNQVVTLTDEGNKLMDNLDNPHIEKRVKEQIHSINRYIDKHVLIEYVRVYGIETTIKELDELCLRELNKSMSENNEDESIKWQRYSMLMRTITDLL